MLISERALKILVLSPMLHLPMLNKHWCGGSAVVKAANNTSAAEEPIIQEDIPSGQSFWLQSPQIARQNHLHFEEVRGSVVTKQEHKENSEKKHCDSFALVPVELACSQSAQFLSLLLLS